MADNTEITTNDLLREISSKLDKLEKLDKLDSIEAKLDSMDLKLDKLDGIEGKLDGIEGKLDAIHQELKQFKNTSLTRDRQLEARVTKLEESVARIRKKAGR